MRWRIVSLLLLILTGWIGYFHIFSLPPWSSFSVSAVSHAPVNLKEFETTFLPHQGLNTVHAASLILLKDGNVRAFWFAGSNEGRPDVVIQTALFDTTKNSWNPPQEVMNRLIAEKNLARYISKIGNPVPVRMSDGSIALFFVTTSIGGWATSAINVIVSYDEGITWNKVSRLITSPFLNLSTLVKSPAIIFADHRVGLPVYHEFVTTFGELLRLESKAGVIQILNKRRMSPGKGTLQPFIFIQDVDYFLQQLNIGFIHNTGN